MGKKRAKVKKKKTVKKKKIVKKKSATPSAKADRLILSIRKFAKLCGVSHTTMGEHIAHPMWPFAKSAPWRESDADLYSAWRAENMKENVVGETRTDPGTMSIITKAQLAVLFERAKKMKLEREIMEGKYLPRDEVERSRVQRIIAIKNWLLRMPRESTSTMDYLTVKHRRKVERDLDQHFRDGLMRMAGMEGASDE